MLTFASRPFGWSRSGCSWNVFSPVMKESQVRAAPLARAHEIRQGLQSWPTGAVIRLGVGHVLDVEALDQELGLEEREEAVAGIESVHVGCGAHQITVGSDQDGGLERRRNGHNGLHGGRPEGKHGKDFVLVDQLLGNRRPLRCLIGTVAFHDLECVAVHPAVAIDHIQVDFGGLAELRDHRTRPAQHGIQADGDDFVVYALLCRGAAC